VSLGALPVANGWSRHVERQADRFALETIPDPGAFIGAMARLAALNLAERDPHRLEEFFLFPSRDRAPDCPRAAVSSPSDLTVCREVSPRSWRRARI
jgi:Zn-dependent protease with chaperone function